jgi:hypothetical protein
MDAIAAALAALPEPLLASLMAAAAAIPDIVPGLRDWLEAATGWEADRRAGRSYTLLGPLAAIPDEAVGAALLAFAALAAPFRTDAPAVARFLDAAAETLRAEAERQGSSLQ